jgi:hypothetical protein
MKRLVQERRKAIELRKKGHSYRDILAEVRVSKSSLSLWLKDLPLTDDEKHYLKKRKDSNITRGSIRAANSNHMRRVVRDGFLLKEAKEDFVLVSKDPFFHVGLALYWAEGAKRNSTFAFMNSDPEMISFMIAWCKKFLKVSETEIGLRLYIHKPYAHENCELFWSKGTGLPMGNFKKTIYKPTDALVKKRPNYKGCVRVELGKVAYLRKIAFWQQMLIEYYKKQGYSTMTPS